jgi:hypothetical protein
MDRRVLAKSGDRETDEASLLKAAYGLVHCLGVTFNPFDISVFGLSLLKKMLLVMRFLYQKPNSFVVHCRGAQRFGADGHHGAATQTARAEASSLEHLCADFTIRCLDPSLAFGHLARSTSCIILASGTLAPFAATESELGLVLDTEHSQDCAAGKLRADTVAVCGAAPAGSALRGPALEGGHVIDAGRQCLVSCLTRTVDGTPLRCTYASLSNATFLHELALSLLLLSMLYRTAPSSSSRTSPSARKYSLMLDTSRPLACCP